MEKLSGLHVWEMSSIFFSATKKENCQDKFLRWCWLPCISLTVEVLICEAFLNQVSELWSSCSSFFSLFLLHYSTICCNLVLKWKAVFCIQSSAPWGLTTIQLTGDLYLTTDIRGGLASMFQVYSGVTFINFFTYQIICMIDPRPNLERTFQLNSISSSVFFY